MWALLLQYLKKTQKVWMVTFLFTLALVGFVSLLFLIPGFLYVVSSLWVTELAVRAVRLIGFDSIANSLVFPLFIVSLIYMPAIALTFTHVLGVAVILSIPSFFEFFDRFAEQEVGIGFSLKKLLLNPRARLEALRPILEAQTLDYATYLNLVNDITTPDTVGYCQPLEFTPEEEEELVARQTYAITQLPVALKLLYAEIEAREWLNMDLDVTIAQKKAAYQVYRSGLTVAQQACFDTYLDSTLELTHAICSVTREPLSPDNQHKFIMLEKRYEAGSNWHAVPHETKFFYLEPGERDMFLNLAQYNKALKRWTITNPLNRDPLFAPSAYGMFFRTQYRRYNYQKIDGYPLSLEVYEAMKAFNESMHISPEETQTAVPQVDSAPTLLFNRSVSSAPSSIGGQNIYTERQRREGGAASPSVVEIDDVYNGIAGIDP